MFHNITLFLVKESQSFIRLGFFFNLFLKIITKKFFLLTKCLYICTSNKAKHYNKNKYYENIKLQRN